MQRSQISAGDLDEIFPAPSESDKPAKRNENVDSKGNVGNPVLGNFAQCLLILELEHLRDVNKLRSENDALRKRIGAIGSGKVPFDIDIAGADNGKSFIADALKLVEREHLEVISKLMEEKRALLECEGKEQETTNNSLQTIRDRMLQRGTPAASLTRSNSYLPPQQMMRMELYKDFMVMVLYMAVFFDTIGMTIMYLSAPLLYNSSEGCPELGALVAQPRNESLAAGLGQFGEDSAQIGYAVALNLGAGLFNGSCVLAKLVAFPLSKSLTKKGCLLLYTFGGGVVYFLTFCTKPDIWDMPWWYFLVMRSICGFLGASPTIVTMIISDLFRNDPEKRETRVAGVMFFIVLAVAVGPIIGAAMIGDLADPEAILRPFAPLTFASIGSIFVGVLVLVFIREPEPDPEEAEKVPAKPVSDETDVGKQSYIRWVVLVLGGRVLDSFGKGYMTYLQTVAFAKFGLLNQFANILIGIGLLAVVALPVAFALKEKIGYAATCALSQFLAGLFLAFLPLPTIAGTYLPMFFCVAYLILFSFILRANMVIEIVPAAVKDKWISRSDAIDDLASVIGPFVLVYFLNNERWGPYSSDGPDSELQRMCDGTYPGMPSSIGVKPACGCMGGTGSNTFGEGTYLVMNGIVLLLSSLPFLVLILRFPCRPTSEYKLKPVTGDDKKALELWRTTGDCTWLRLELQWNEYIRILKEGDEPKKGQFGSWASDMQNFDKFMDMADEDSSFYQHHIVPTSIHDFQRLMSTESGKKQMEQEIQMWRSTTKMSLEQKWDIGRWFIDYLEWAGYVNPAKFPRLYKVVFMECFPKLGYEYGWSSPEMLNDPIPQVLSEFNYFDKMLDLQQRKKIRDVTTRGIRKSLFRSPSLA